MYEQLTRQELDQQYSPSSRAPDYQAILRRYRELSDGARQRFRHEADVSYGTSAAETLHFFPSARPSADIHVFVHGGHWQESSKEDACFAAPAFLRAGAAFIALGYGLAPERTLDDMVHSVRRGLWWVAEHARDLGVRPGGVYAGGSSAGAHLVAMAVAHTGATPPPVAGVALLSGVYDLEPVRHSYVNERVGMSRCTAQANSPVGHLPLATPRVLVARGVAETREYARQQQLFVDALRAAGQACADHVIEGRNHFDLPLDLGDPATRLGRAVLAQMDLLSDR
ncbi:alpha/beta hydrolase [Nocardia sp. CA-135953]|uniref:alpha/beta hydrolase n=1 Tax=Nocardia sp. CA-135953 TaxID=3239978 RepID=UPI003D9A0870